MSVFLCCTLLYHMFCQQRCSGRYSMIGSCLWCSLHADWSQVRVTHSISGCAFNGWWFAWSLAIVRTTKYMFNNRGEGTSSSTFRWFDLVSLKSLYVCLPWRYLVTHLLIYIYGVKYFWYTKCNHDGARVRSVCIEIILYVMVIHFDYRGPPLFMDLLFS